MMDYKPLGNFIVEYSQRNDNSYRPVAVGRYGIRTRESIYSKELAKDYSKNKVIFKNTLTVGMGSVQIDIGVLTDDMFYSVSPAYHTYKIEGIDAEYLKYCLECRNQDMFMRYVKRGSRQGKTIDLKRWLLYEIPVYSPDEQRGIVRNLDFLQNIIEKRLMQLEKYDDFVKSQFIEMFGNIGEDTKGWGLVALDECCELNPKKSREVRLKAGIEVSFIPMPAVSEDGVIDCSVVKQYEQVQTGFTYFAENDVLFAKITPCMENGKGAIARGLKNGLGFGSTEFHVLRPLNGVCNPAWLYALTTFTKFRHDAAKKMTGSAGQRRVPASFLATYKVSVPPIELQNKFASFVEQTDKSKVLMERCIFLVNTLRKVEKTKGICYNIASKEVV